MKSIFNKLTIIILLSAMASCTNDFLNENLESSVVPAGESAVIISPEWEPGDYQFYLPGVGNVDFEIITTPSWLQINSRTGELVNSQATIHCSATKRSDFDKIGIYLDKMEVLAENRKFYVPVAYITEGNPTIQVQKSLTISDYYCNLRVSNPGKGVLIWDIVSLPDWLTVNTDNSITDITGITNPITSPYSSTSLYLTFNSNIKIKEDLAGTIVLQTNDKNNPRVEIDVKVDFGSPEIDVWGVYDNKIDFGVTNTTYQLEICAWRSGLLVWYFEDMPDWLTITPSKGMYYTHLSYDDIILTCDRTKLQPGLNSSVIHLKSNAYNKPSIAITVSAQAPDNS
ncbi:hypothetical protein LJC52_00135 [Bacteroidales bacterium OttesenSCG-928-A17]|nr:hypothetical protein [Bacteroidales bacterium OttesenSCG-928-A17]